MAPGQRVVSAERPDATSSMMDSMHGFNAPYDEEDVEQLEREI